MRGPRCRLNIAGNEKDPGMMRILFRGQPSVHVRSAWPTQAVYAVSLMGKRLLKPSP